MKIAIITGTRNTATEAQQREIQEVIYALAKRGYSFYFGDAQGVDEVAYKCAIDQDYRNNPKFSAMPLLKYHRFFPTEKLGRSPAGLAERSTRIVKTAINDSHGDHVVCVGFPSTDCPDTITPARTWKSGKSGTWSTVALAQGHQIETWIFNTMLQHGATGTAWSGTWRREIFFDTMPGWRYYDVNNEFAFFPNLVTELYREE